MHCKVKISINQPRDYFLKKCSLKIICHNSNYVFYKTINVSAVCIKGTRYVLLNRNICTHSYFVKYSFIIFKCTNWCMNFDFNSYTPTVISYSFVIVKTKLWMHCFLQKCQTLCQSYTSTSTGFVIVREICEELACFVHWTVI